MQSVLLLADYDLLINHLFYKGGITLSPSVDIASSSHHKAPSNNSRLSNFMEAIDPTKSFLDLSLLLDEPVEEVISFLFLPVFLSHVL